ncbi:MAG: phosphoribosylanthranilate isomerase [Spirochaetia bacterium]|nr:phosphoribosylanthranilate isomerase [Spirochaetia bacterium]
MVKFTVSIKYRNIKVCGLTSIDDARAAVWLGADLLGMVMHPKSPRFCEPEIAQKIIQSCSFKPCVLVFADNEIDYAKELISHLDFNLVYFQAPSESKLYKWFCENYSFDKIIPVYSVPENFADKGSFAKPLGGEIDQFKNHPWIILDTGGVVSKAGETLYGGTGKTFDWNLVRNLNRKYFLAGGLKPDNIYEAMDITNAPAYDVSSGIESTPGKKDLTKMKRFILTIREYDKKTNEGAHG